MEEEQKKETLSFQIGQDLSDLSVDELEDIIGTLKEEISRLQEAVGAKSSHINAAEALFK